MAVEALDQRSVLLILVPHTAAEAAFVSGVARWDAGSGQLSIKPASGGSPLRIGASRDAMRGFAPTVLPRLLVADHRDAVLALAAGVEACVAVFTDLRPAGVALFRQPFFGVSGNPRTGEVFLMQGADEIEWEDDEDSVDDDDASWAEPWPPDAPAT